MSQELFQAPQKSDATPTAHPLPESVHLSDQHAMTSATNSKSMIGDKDIPQGLAQLCRKDPDLIDRIFDYLLSDGGLKSALEKMSSQPLQQAIEQAKTAVRAEFGGVKTYVSKRKASAEKELKMREVLRLFNGRNATEVGRRLRISSRTVYRYIKQAKADKK